MNKAAVRPSRLILTHRDQQLLEWVDRFHLLSRDQVMAVVGFHSLTRANTRLGTLLRAKLVSRKRLPVVPGTGSAQSLYYVGPASTKFLDADPARIAAQIRRISRWDARQVTHVVAANQVLIDFVVAIRRTQQLQLLSFQTEPELRRAFLGQPLVPDGWLAWVEQGRRFNCFTEVDLAHEGLEQWRRKVVEYHRYRESGLHQELFGFRSFKVLVLTTSGKRLENFRKTSALAEQVFLFAKFADITAETILGPAWLTVTGQEPIRLNEVH
jgi:hypothetical protein